MRKRSGITGHADIVLLRQRYEEIDARYFQIRADVSRTLVDRGGVPGEWIAVPQTRDDRVILYLHGGSLPLSKGRESCRVTGIQREGDVPRFTRRAP